MPLMLFSPGAFRDGSRRCRFRGTEAFRRRSQKRRLRAQLKRRLQRVRRRTQKTCKMPATKQPGVVPRNFAPRIDHTHLQQQTAWSVGRSMFAR